MRTSHIICAITAFSVLLGVSGCQSKKKTPPSTSTPSAATTTAAVAQKKYDKIERLLFNRIAVQLDLPLFWIQDSNNNKQVDPDEVASLVFYPSAGDWVAAGKFTATFDAAYDKMVKWADSPDYPANLSPEEKNRRSLVLQELDQGLPTLIFNDFSASPNEDKGFVRHMLAIAQSIDELYSAQRGLAPWYAQIPKDHAASFAMFRRNWGPKCLAPKTEKNPSCSAVPSAPQQVPVGMYPEDLQKETKFCDKLASQPNGAKLLSPFVAVKQDGENYEAEPVTEKFKSHTQKISKQLRDTAGALNDPKDTGLKDYLLAASQAFLDNNWEPADEAWAKMNASNSRWYVRVAPDETYWGPCNRKAGFHVSFAKINEASLKWQKKLEPVQQAMEDDLAKLIGAPYKARKVTFQLPDFIDIILNAGDARHPLGATIGQSLPNWGPVANEGRGRTVVMSNLYTDPDSVAVRNDQARSMLDKATDDKRGSSQEPLLFSVILHEAAHNFGPSHEYKVGGKTDDEAFGGPLASMLEELKAQTASLWYVDYLKNKQIIDQAFAEQTYVDDIIWALNHIARGLYTEDGKPKTYSHVAAVQVGFLLKEGALSFDKETQAANRKDKGAFTVHFDKFPQAVEKLMKLAGSIKAKADKAQAEQIVKEFVDGDIVPKAMIEERSLRQPKAAFLYSFKL